jgi:hypothetical protein
MSLKAPHGKVLARWRDDPVHFIEHCLTDPETNESGSCCYLPRRRCRKPNFAAPTIAVVRCGTAIRVAI